MSNKKGFAITFSWIFSLVAGALIFIFLVYFSVQHTDLFGKRSNVLIREEFDNAFGSLKSTDITTNIELDERITLKFQCFDGRIRFGVGKGDKKEIPGKIIAAPEELSGYNFSIKTESLIRPFKIASFIYIDSDEQRIYTSGDPLEKAEKYAGDENYEKCIVPMIEGRLELVKNVYKNKADLLNGARDSDGRVCIYSNLRDKIEGLTINSDVQSIIKANEEMVRRGCPALF